MAKNTGPNPYSNLDQEDWWHPEEISIEDPLLSEKQISSFHQDGFIVVTGLWPAGLIERASKEATQIHPTEEVIERGRGLSLSPMPWLAKKAQGIEIAADAALNHMTIHPRPLAVVAQLMNVDEMDIRLSQSHIIAKLGAKIDRPGDPNHGEMSGDQEIHVDYGNNTLMVPPNTKSPEAIACLCYYSDVDECGGATHFARALPGELTSYRSAQFNPPNFVAATADDRSDNGQGPRSSENISRLYETEKPVYYKPGTCILYGLNAWHRGTPAALGKIRYTHNHVWRHRNAEWVNWQSLAPKLAGMSTRYLEQLSVLQRTVLGFAAPGNPYWTDETLDAVGQRYPGMDMTPYRKAQLKTV
jgi:hypothetical protein